MGTAVRRHWLTVSTIGDLLDRRAAEQPDRTAVVFPDDRASYAELAERVTELGRALLGLGVRPGDRIAVLLTNSLDMYTQLLAAARIGAIAVPVNARFKSTELRHIVRHSGARVLVTTTDNSAVDFVALLGETFPGLAHGIRDEALAAETPELRHVVLLGDASRLPGSVSAAGLATIAASVPADTAEEYAASVKIRDPAFLVYTSGTTAAPKGAILSHEAIVRLADGIAHERLDIRPDDAVWTAIPLFHGGGITFAVTCLAAACTLVHAGHFDPVATPAYLETERVTIAFAAFETIWLPVLDRPDFADRDLSRLRLVMVVGVPERLRDMAERVPQAVQISCVAMTESAAFLCLGRPEDPLDKRLFTGGHPMSGMRCRIVDPDTGAEVAPGVPGELLFRGPNSFDGYFRDPELTAASIDPDGWFHTGDLVVADEDGRLTFVSRRKDMLKVGGENVAAAEVEGFLLGHPAVHIVQVVGAPDGYYVEVPAAFVELKPGASATEQELIEFCLGRIATYRVPRYVRFVTDWPMSGTKIQKYKLRKEITDELAEKGIERAPKLALRQPTN